MKPKFSICIFVIFSSYHFLNVKDLLKRTCGKSEKIEKCKKSVREISLKDNGITFLQDDDFDGFWKVRSINLENNEISEILQNKKQLHKNCFHQTPLLENLNLSKNKLAVLKPTTFFELKNLKILNLSQNNLHRVENLQFGGPLIQLDFSRNELYNNAHNIFHCEASICEVN